jgi:hypothetical protein
MSHPPIVQLPFNLKVIFLRKSLFFVQSGSRWVWISPLDVSSVLSEPLSSYSDSPVHIRSLSFLSFGFSFRLAPVSSFFGRFQSQALAKITSFD